MIIKEELKRLRATVDVLTSRVDSLEREKYRRRMSGLKAFPVDEPGHVQDYNPPVKRYFVFIVRQNPYLPGNGKMLTVHATNPEQAARICTHSVKPGEIAKVVLAETVSDFGRGLNGEVYPFVR